MNASPVWSPAIGLYILDIDAVVISTKDPLIWNHGHHPKQAIPELSLEGVGQIDKLRWEWEGHSKHQMQCF